MRSVWLISKKVIGDGATVSLLSIVNFLDRSCSVWLISKTSPGKVQSCCRPEVVRGLESLGIIQAALIGSGLFVACRSGY